jgi:hypothetical protein
MWSINGQTITAGRSFKDTNGVTHPANWASVWSDEYKSEIGVTYTAPVAAAPVDRTLNADGSTKTIAEAVVTFKRLVNDKCFQALETTDWHYIKAIEVDGYTVPSDIVAWRIATRNHGNTIIASLEAAADIDAFYALIDAGIVNNGWPVSP